jgi:Sulfatase
MTNSQSSYSLRATFTSLLRKILTAKVEWRTVALLIAIAFGLSMLKSQQSIPRPLVNIDLLVVAFLYATKIRSLTGVTRFLLIVVLLGEVLEVTMRLTNVPAPILLHALDYWQEWPWPLLGQALAIAIVTGFGLWLLWRFLPRWAVSVWLLPAVAIGTIALDASHNNVGTFNATFRPGQFLPSTAPPIVFSSTFSLLAAGSIAMSHSQPPAPRIEGVASYNAIKATPAGSDVLVIVIESLGLLVDPNERRQFEADATKALGFSQNAVVSAEEFYGSTVFGEIRVLCSLGVGDVEASIRSTECLPETFSSRGYHVAAAHANWPAVFNRKMNYPSLGFQALKFRSDSDTRLCGTAIVGLCDADLLGWLLRPTPDQRPRFMYLLTMETHLPLPSCKGAEAITVENYKDCQIRALQAIGGLLSQIKRPTRVVIVGDHAPPIISQGNVQRVSTKLVALFVDDIVPTRPSTAKGQPPG